MPTEIMIRPLEPCLLDDYLYFFDNVAFADHQEWSWCYCTYFHLGAQEEKKLEEELKGQLTRDTLRDIAIDLIKNRKLRGYLAYAGDQVVGWCNASDKKNYKKLCENQDIWDDGETLSITSVTCFVVAPGFRRKGVAAALLGRVIQDAASGGYEAVEAYPAAGELDCYLHFHGHPSMYAGSGFVLHKELKGYSVYRKML